MEDFEIIDLFFERNEDAIAQCENKYGKYLAKISYNILGDTEDCREIINDSLLKVWNKIPPDKPANLKLFIAKITRENAIDYVRKKSSKKRNGGEYFLSLDELSECVSENNTVEHETDARELGKILNCFLKKLSKEKRDIFVLRYYFFYSISDISSKKKISEAKVKTTLHRMRTELKSFLSKEGYNL